jgi:cysteine desulfurase
VGAHTTQVVFTSGGTEADNLAIQGICANLTTSQIAVSAIEHPAVMKPAVAMQRHGWRLTKIGVDAQGLVDEDGLQAVLQQPTGLLSVMLANNETGVLQDVVRITALARKHGVLVHTDAVQALGKMALDFQALGVHAMSLSAHKIGGPQGVGALVLDKRIDLQPLIYGGGQEKGLRSGSENIAAIVGFGAACAMLPLGDLSNLRDRLENGLRTLGAVIFGAQAERIGNTCFFAFENVDGETLVMALDRAGYAVASGSACSSDSSDPSPVLMAMGVSPTLAQGAVRVSLGPENTTTEIDGFLEALRAELARMQSMAALAV